MNTTRITGALALALTLVFAAGCGITDERSQRIDRVSANLSYDQKQIRDTIIAFFQHLVRQEIDDANLLIAKPNRFSTADSVRWNEEVSNSEAKRKEIRAILNDAPLYWDQILVYPEGKAIFRYPPNPSMAFGGITSGCSVEMVREEGVWRINTWNIQ